MGCYVGHGETYMHPEDILWWAKGGVLHGESPARIAFLREILEAAPGGLNPLKDQWYDWRMQIGVEGEYYLLYFGVHAPRLETITTCPRMRNSRWISLMHGR